MSLKTVFLGTFTAVGLFACQSDASTTLAAQNESSGMPMSQHSEVADINRVQSHLYFLADDLLEGRQTGSVGHEIASKYIESEFKKYGLKPLGDIDASGEHSYFQRIQFRRAVLEQSSPSFTFKTADGEESLSYPKEYLTFANVAHSDAKLEGELIFAGYGIIAPQLDHNDYEGLDVNGKVVVVLSGKPASFPSEEGAHFGSTSEKKKHAVANGAIGYITISTPTAEKVRPYQNLLNFIYSPRMLFLDKDDEPVSSFPELLNTAYLGAPAAKRLFAHAEKSIEDVYAMLQEDQSPKGFPLNVSVSLNSKSEFSNVSSPNVIGLLEGSDPNLKNEYIVYSAHSDHLGIAKTVKKNKINNGAMDNASGVSIMLETARLFSLANTAPKRSILFIAVTAEEKGLLGSKYYAQNPTVPIDNLVANVNIDMPVLTFEFTDVIAFGASHSDMKSSVTQSVEKIGMELTPDPWPEQAIFTRSDHYSFVQQGVPAVFLVSGIKAADPSVDGSKLFGEFLSTHYHKPTDDLNLPFNWKAAKKFTEVNFQIGKTLANQPIRPSWNEGDFFGEVFSRND